MISYEWNIEQLEFYPEHNGYENVVFSVFWRCNAQEADVSATSYGSISVELEKDVIYIPFADLTKDIVLNWVKQSLGDDRVIEIERTLAETIESKKAPKSIVGPPPWLSEPESA